MTAVDWHHVHQEQLSLYPSTLGGGLPRADRHRGWLGVLRGTLDSLTSARGPQAAAALSYYALFSLFPLGVLLITALGFFIDADTAQQLIGLLLQRILPDAQGIEELVFDTLDGVFTSHGEVTVISLIALLWAASGVFTNLTFNLDLAWSGNSPPNVFTARLMGLLIVVLVYVGLVMLLLSSATLGVLSMLPAALLRWLGFSGQLAGMDRPRYPVRHLSVGLLWAVQVGATRQRAQRRLLGRCLPL